MFPACFSLVVSLRRLGALARAVQARHPRLGSSWLAESSQRRSSLVDLITCNRLWILDTWLSSVPWKQPTAVMLSRRNYGNSSKLILIQNLALVFWSCLAMMIMNWLWRFAFACGSLFVLEAIFALHFQGKNMQCYVHILTPPFSLIDKANYLF